MMWAPVNMDEIWAKWSGKNLNGLQLILVYMANRFMWANDYGPNVHTLSGNHRVDNNSI